MDDPQSGQETDDHDFDSISDSDFVPESADGSSDSENSFSSRAENWLTSWSVSTSVKKTWMQSADALMQVVDAGNAATYEVVSTSAQSLNVSTSVQSPKVTSTTFSTSEISVHQAANWPGRRVYNKLNKCKFCTVLTTNLTKHLFSKKHRYEPEVAEFLSKDKNSERRDFLLEKIRNQGNYQHNCSVLQENKGELIPWRSPSGSDEVNPYDYIPCEYCLGFFLKKELWRHQQRCKFKSPRSQKSRRCISRSEALLPSWSECSKGLQENVFGSMNTDNITFIAKKDFLIVMYAEKMYQKHGHIPHRRSFIRQKIRELSRFLQTARVEDSTVTDLQSCLRPDKFLVVVSIVRRLCVYDSAKNVYGNPSLALKLGHSLKKCAGILRNQALMKGNEELQKTSAGFIHLCDSDWKDYISSSALSTLGGKRYNKVHVLPLTEDLKKVTEHMQKERKRCLSALQSEPIISGWHALAKVSLSNIIIFNRRRSGEASRMLMTEYQNAKRNILPADDILAALSGMEKTLIENFLRVEVHEKRGNVVPVLLTASMQAEIEQLLVSREQVGVNPANEYVFARPHFGSGDHLAGHTCLRETVQASGAEHPEAITSTKMRKHLATVSQILNLSEHELAQVCGFLGHNISVHREFYRLPQDTYQLAKVSRLLLAAESGGIARFQGKSLVEIELEKEMEFRDSEVEDDVLSDADVEGCIETERDPTVDEEQGNQGSKKHLSESGVLSDKNLLKANNAKRSVEKSSRVRDDRADTPRTKVAKSAKHKDFLTSHQTDIIKRHFKRTIESHIVPRKHECEEILQKEPALQGKTWMKIKCTVRNEIEKTKRQIQRAQNR